MLDVVPSPLVGEGYSTVQRKRTGEGLLRFKSRQQVSQHAFGIFQHIRIPVSRNSKSLRPNVGVPQFVCPRFHVLSAVNLDHQPSLEANEVENVRSKRRLPPKLDAVKTAVAQQKPKPPLDICRDAAHPARILTLLLSHELMVRCVRHEPLTQRRLLTLLEPPSPTRGEGTNTTTRSRLQLPHRPLISDHLAVVRQSAGRNQLHGALQFRHSLQRFGDRLFEPVARR